MPISKSRLIYGLYSNRPVSINLYEAEGYINAVIVQQLVGNLVRFSNKGRYEAFLAREWKQVNPYQWIFSLKDDLSCDNGEPITAVKFKKSIELSILQLSKAGPVPALGSLNGATEYLKSKGKGEVTGLEVNGQDLIFNFREPIHTGLVQILSFAPFGYICTSNRDQSTGAWSTEKFASSGSYTLESFEKDKRYSLKLREKPILKIENQPSTVEILVTNDNPTAYEAPFIFDNSLNSSARISNSTIYPLVPEYLTHINLSQRGIFKNRSIRDHFATVFAKKKASELLDLPFGATLADSFYPTQKSNSLKTELVALKPSEDLPEILIMGKEPSGSIRLTTAWKVLRATLEEIGWKYRFENIDRPMMESLDPSKYDIRIGSTSIGGGVEPWGIDTIFCSDLGARLPDPSGIICKSLKDFKSGLLNESAFTEIFNKAVNNENGVIPVFHQSVVLQPSEGIDLRSMSPLISVIRFDELQLEN